MENKFDVTRRGEEIMFSCPVPPTVSREDALNLAAWLVVASAKIGPGIYTDPKGKFIHLLDEILQRGV